MATGTLRTVTLLQPPRVVFGAGCLRDCSEYLARRGVRHPLLVSSPPVVGLAQPLIDALRASGARVSILADITAEPTVDMFTRCLAAANAEPVDCVIGFGGGSALDAAKLLAALHRSGRAVKAFFGIGLLPGRPTHLVCVPTTAGTGSEVSPTAILLDESDQLKKGVVSPFLVPDAAFVDPALTLTVPPAVTAATGLDALTHCIEAFANRHAHPLVDVYALEGIRLIGANLLRAVHHGHDLEARTAVALGSLYAEVSALAR